eukprot:8393853-Pyramimonas_sp.AAC.1
MSFLDARTLRKGNTRWRDGPSSPFPTTQPYDSWAYAAPPTPRGAPGRSLGCFLAALLRPLGGRFGASWGLFWALGGPLGASWGFLGVLGASWGRGIEIFVRAPRLGPLPGSRLGALVGRLSLLGGFLGRLGAKPLGPP